MGKIFLKLRLLLIETGPQCSKNIFWIVAATCHLINFNTYVLVTFHLRTKRKLLGQHRASTRKKSGYESFTWKKLNRWDVQRIREQRHVARLRARYDPNEDHVSLGGSNLSSKLMPLNAESSKDFSSLTTLLPDPEEADEIVVQEKLPVSVFGCVLPNLGVHDFSLPWLS